MTPEEKLKKSKKDIAEGLLNLNSLANKKIQEGLSTNMKVSKIDPPKYPKEN